MKSTHTASDQVAVAQDRAGRPSAGGSGEKNSSIKGCGLPLLALQQVVFFLLVLHVLIGFLLFPVYSSTGCMKL